MKTVGEGGVMGQAKVVRESGRRGWEIVEGDGGGRKRLERGGGLWVL